MNYELAKELKDAGFPQARMGVHDITNEPNVAYEPTLSELIEACGKDFGALHHNDIGGWCAVSRGDEHPSEPAITGGVCSTPEEAVARLWLALNKK